MDLNEKIARCAQRVKSIKLDKKNRRKCRSNPCNIQGRINVGNSCKGSPCTRCTPGLTTSLLRKQNLRNYLAKLSLYAYQDYCIDC
jgi:hypothetical protein